LLWFVLALVSAFTGATSDALTKRYFSHQLNAFEMGLIRLLYGLPFLAVMVALVPWPSISLSFWGLLAVLYPLEALALVLYMRAIAASPLSLTLPFLAFTPVFLIGTGLLFLGELPNLAGAIGIALIVAGSYVLNLSALQGGWLEPFRAVGRERGSLLMLAVAFIYSITSALGKVAIHMSSPAFFGALYPALLAAALTVIYPLAGKASLAKLARRPWLGLLLGVVYAGMYVSHAVAISLVQAAYMIAVKRTSMLFGVAYGGIWFHEERIMERLGGAGLMVLGVALIVVFG
jgi:drug/metabolite transporter (DMT)-like permease